MRSSAFKVVRLILAIGAVLLLGTGASQALTNDDSTVKSGEGPGLSASPYFDAVKALAPLLTEVQGQLISAAQKHRTLSELENGSRYFVQARFLKTLLANQAEPEAEKHARFDHLIDEINAYLARDPQTIVIETPEDLERFKSSLNSRFTTLNDEMEFSKGLADQAPIKLRVSEAMKEDVLKFSEAFRSLDRPIIGSIGLSFFDLLSDGSLAGVLFRYALKSVAPGVKAKQLRDVAKEFEKQSQRLTEVAPHLLEQHAISFQQPAEQRFFELLISHYFSTYTFAESADVMKSVIERPDLQSPDDLFRLMVLHAGPQMQKLLQVAARKPGLSSQLSQTFKRLEETGLASPWEKQAPLMTKAPIGNKWVSIDPLARVGSIAEVYRGIVRDRNGRQQKVAIRVLKDRIRERVENEIPRLRDLAHAIDTDPLLRSYQFPLVGPVMDDVMSMAKAELSLPDTIENQNTGERIYTATKKIRRGLIVNFVTPHTLPTRGPRMMVSTWIEGDTFEEFVKRQPQLGLEVAEATSRHWIENAMFGERFFHADLHQGNVKVKENADGTLTVGFLDFGMVGRLEKRERSLLIRLSLATARKQDPALIARYAFELSEKTANRISLSELQQSAADYQQKNIDHPELLTMDMWLGWSLSKGLKLPRNITAFSRGLGTVDQLTHASGSAKSMAEMVTSVALRHAFELAPDLVGYLKDSLQSRFSSRFSKATESGPTLRCESVFAN